MNTYFNSKKVSLTAYLFCCISFFTFSQTQTTNFTESEESAYHDIIRLDFNKARQQLDSSTSASAYLLHFAYSLELFISEDPQLYENYEDTQGFFVEIIENQGDYPATDFYLAEIKLRSAFINLKFGNELTAAWNVRQAYKLITQNIEKYPDFLPNNKTVGLLHTMIGSIPEKYQWIVGLMGMDGNVSDGLNELSSIAKGKTIFSIEGRVMMAVINAYLLDKQKKAANEMLTVYRENPTNELLAYITTALLIKNSQAHEAIALSQKLNPTQLTLFFYLAAEAYLQLGDYKKSEELLMRFANNFKGQNFIKDAYYKLFLCAWLSNNTQKADAYHAQAKRLGQTLTEVDKHADKMIRSAHPNKDIMKIRLLTDGGSYEQANTLVLRLDRHPFKNSKDQVEFIYRQARLAHKQRETSVAIGYYKEVITLQAENWYFAPNSCLQLGYIYQSQNKPNEAQKYFIKAMSYKNHEYKTSIANKAKAALNNL